MSLYTHTLLALLSVQFVVVLLLSLHLRELGSQTVDDRVRDQDLLGKVSLLLVRSSTQTNQLLAYDDASRACSMIDGIIARYGGCTRSGKHLRIDTVRLTALRTKARQRLASLRAGLHQPATALPPHEAYQALPGAC